MVTGHQLAAHASMMDVALDRGDIAAAEAVEGVVRHLIRNALDLLDPWFIRAPSGSALEAACDDLMCVRRGVCSARSVVSGPGLVPGVFAHNVVHVSLCDDAGNRVDDVREADVDVECTGCVVTGVSVRADSRVEIGYGVCLPPIPSLTLRLLRCLWKSPRMGRRLSPSASR